MKFFMKLNMISAFYALLFFINCELLLNAYRISDTTGWGRQSYSLISILNVALFILGTIVFLYLSKRWMNGRIASFWSVLLWIPYSILFLYMFARLFPMTNPGEVPNPGMGFVILFGFISYPIYIGLINFVGSILLVDKTV